MAITTALHYLEEHKDDFVNRLFEFLRIPSISTLPENKADIDRAARWCSDLLTNAGLDAHCMATDLHPAVVGQYHANDGPRLMLYGHYDVQPAGDRTLWKSAPFEPTVRDDAVFARGAADDKGQALANLLALECWLKGAGSLPVNRGEARRRRRQTLRVQN